MLVKITYNFDLSGVNSLASGLVLIPVVGALTAQLGGAALVKEVLRAGWHVSWGLFLSFYIFRQPIREYFGLMDLNKMRAIIFLGLCFLMLLFVKFSQVLPLFSKAS